MSTEQNKALYRRYIEEVFNQGQLATLDEVLAPDYVYRDAPPGTPPGAAAIKQVVTMFHAAFPDFRIELEELVAEGDKVCARATSRGTHSGPMFGIAPTGRKITMHGFTMVRVADGRIQESWVTNDVLGLLAQLGATSLPGPAAP